MQWMQKFSTLSRDYSGKGMLLQVSTSVLKVGLGLQINLKRDYEYLEELMSVLKPSVPLNWPKASWSWGV